MEMKESVLSRMTNEVPDKSGFKSKTSCRSFADVLVEHLVQNPDYPMEDVLTDIKCFMIAVGLIYL